VAVAPQHQGLELGLELAGRGRRGSVVREAGARESGSGAGDRTLLGLGFRVVARRGANELRIGGEMEEDSEAERASEQQDGTWPETATARAGGGGLGAGVRVCVSTRGEREDDNEGP
jgi:hypothetical protein